MVEVDLVVLVDLELILRLVQLLVGVVEHQQQTDLDKVLMELQIVVQVVLVLLVVQHHQVQVLLQVAVVLEL
jgi:hypothetical protein